MKLLKKKNRKALIHFLKNPVTSAVISGLSTIGVARIAGAVGNRFPGLLDYANEALDELQDAIAEFQRSINAQAGSSREAGDSAAPEEEFRRQ